MTLLRHASDAAWLYTQFDPDRASFLVDCDRMRHYQRIFVAHLDGLRFGGTRSAEIAHEQLQRWKGPGELFVCVYLALYTENTPLFGAAWSFLETCPEPHFIDAVATALLWLPTDNTAARLERLALSEDTLARQLVLNACGLRRDNLAQDITSLFSHTSKGLRAEACRYAGRLRRFDRLPWLRRALSDDDQNVREQAAIALLLCNEPQDALPELYTALQHYNALVDAGEGSVAIRAERRAQYLARLLGHAIPFPCPEAATDILLSELPPYLTLLTLAHHGNPIHVQRLLPFMRERADGLYKRRALWSMCFMLGINPESECLVTETPSLSVDWPSAPGLDQDTGLPEPNADNVEQWWHAHQSAFSSTNAPYLSGHVMCDSATIKSLLTDGMQGQRFAASLHIARLSRQAPWIDTRSPFALQRSLWTSLFTNKRSM